MYVDGQQVANHINTSTAAAVAGMDRPPRATFITCAPTVVTKQYLERKQEQATQLGIVLTVRALPAESSTEEVIAAIAAAVPDTDAIVVQLPLPAHIDTDAVLASVPPEYDVDGLGPEAAYISPVAGAIGAIAEQYEIVVRDSQAVVLGAGRLVGRPVAAWLQQQGATVTVLTEHTPNPAALATADIVVTGVGKPHLLQPDMLKPGVALFDAGTSESGGEVRGDIDPACAASASYITPVPGGIGPITIAVLLQHIAHAAVARANR